MLPELPPADAPWEPHSVLLESQGLAILRGPDRYVSLECGPYAGGHGHPDRLQLTLYAEGVHWLPDPGTGQYVTRDLFWYRSTLAHNAPRLDAESQPPGNASCESFDVQDDWAWTRGRFDNLHRTITSGPAYVVDIVELTGREEHLLELPWHVAGRGAIETKGRWVADELADEFVTRVQRFVPDERVPIVLTHGLERAELTIHLLSDGELLEVEGPGLPSHGDRASFYVVRVRARNPRLVTVLEPHKGDAVVRAVRAVGDTVEIQTIFGTDRHRLGTTDWTIEQEG
jgi:hypothetical protein